jgi:hypothetical protein
MIRSVFVPSIGGATCGTVKNMHLSHYWHCLATARGKCSRKKAATNDNDDDDDDGVNYSPVAVVADPALIERLIDWVESARNTAFGTTSDRNPPTRLNLGVFASTVHSHFGRRGVTDGCRRRRTAHGELLDQWLATRLQSEMRAYDPAKNGSSSSTSSDYDPYLAYLHQQAKVSCPWRGPTRARRCFAGSCSINRHREDVVDWIDRHYTTTTTTTTSGSPVEHIVSAVVIVNKDILASTMQFLARSGRYHSLYQSTNRRW